MCAVSLVAIESASLGLQFSRNLFYASRLMSKMCRVLYRNEATLSAYWTILFSDTFIRIATYEFYDESDCFLFRSTYLNGGDVKKKKMFFFFFGFPYLVFLYAIQLFGGWLNDLGNLIILQLMISIGYLWCWCSIHEPSILFDAQMVTWWWHWSDWTVQLDIQVKKTRDTERIVRK